MDRFMAFDVFISCSTRDQELGRKVCKALDAHEVSYWSPLALKAGQQAAPPNVGRVVLLIFTRNANGSQRIAKEINFALARKIPVVVLAAEKVNPIKAIRPLVKTDRWHKAYGSSKTEGIEQVVYAITMETARQDLGAKRPTPELKTKPSGKPPKATLAPSDNQAPAPVPQRASMPITTPRPQPRPQPKPQPHVNSNEPLPPPPPEPPSTKNDASKGDSLAGQSMFEVDLDDELNDQANNPEQTLVPFDMRQADAFEAGALELANDIALDEPQDAIDKPVALDMIAPAEGGDEPIALAAEPGGGEASVPEGEGVDPAPAVIEAVAVGSDEASQPGDTYELVLDEPDQHATAPSEPAPSDPPVAEPAPALGALDLLGDVADTPDASSAETPQVNDDDDSSPDIDMNAMFADLDKKAADAEPAPTPVDDPPPVEAAVLPPEPGPESEPEREPQAAPADEADMNFGGVDEAPAPQPDDDVDEEVIDQTPHVARRTKPLILAGMFVAGAIVGFAAGYLVPHAATTTSSVAPIRRPAPTAPQDTSAAQAPAPTETPTPTAPPKPQVAIAPPQTMPPVTRPPTRTAAPTPTPKVQPKATPEKTPEIAPEKTPQPTAKPVATVAPAAPSKPTPPPKPVARPPGDLHRALAGLDYNQVRKYDAGLNALKRSIDKTAQAKSRTLAIARDKLAANTENFDAQAAFGQTLLHAGQFAEAESLFNQLIESYSRTSRALAGRGIARLEQGRTDDAIADLGAAIELEPATSTRLALADAYLRDGKTQPALRQLGMAIKRAGVDPKPAVKRGRVYLGIGDLRAAMADFNRAATIDNEYAPAYLGRGLAYEAQNKYDQAVDQYHRALQLDRRFTAASVARGRTRLAMGDFNRAAIDLAIAAANEPNSLETQLLLTDAHRQAGNYAQALSSADQALLIDPLSAAAHTVRAALLIQRHHYDQALEHTAWAAHLDPSFSRAYAVRAAVLQAQGKWTLALDAFGRALSADPAALDALVGRCRLRRRAGDLQGAMADADAAIKAHPNAVAAYIERALVWRNRAAMPRGIDDCDRALQINPQSADAHLHRAMIQLAQRRANSALGNLDSALHAKPTFPQAYAVRAAAYLLDGEVARSKVYADAAIKTDPDNASCYAVRAWLRYAQDHYDSAREDVAKALELNPRELNALSLRAAMALAGGKPAEALADADRVLKLNPNHLRALYVRARAYRALGQKKKAAADLARVKRVVPSAELEKLDWRDLEFY